MSEQVVLICAAGAPFIAFYLYFRYREQCSFRERVKDISKESESDEKGAIFNRYKLKHRLTALGLYLEAEQRAYEKTERACPLWTIVLTMTIMLVFVEWSLPRYLIGVGSGLGLGVMVNRIRFERRKAAFTRELEFFLPILMEELVMAVQAGLDILPALHAVTKSTRREHAACTPAAAKKTDPVRKLLVIVLDLSEAGLLFDAALAEVADSVQCSAVRHAFVHLGVAFREGGEVVMPLRELSDATQLYYQEVVEEEIAKLPVKATMPLVLTFSGLLVCFITAPLMQVMSLTHKAVSSGEVEK